MFKREDPYGLKKRLAFASQLLEQKRASHVLEVGCGTGALLLQPLALKYPDCHFTGIDSDAASIDYANNRFQYHNLNFSTSLNQISQSKFQIVIASEVLEHVDEPLKFLQTLRSYLSPDGALLLTVPNGYGAFEWFSTLQICLDKLGVIRMLVKLKRSVFKKAHPLDVETESVLPMSLAVSPHINFFGFHELRRLLEDAGYEIEVQRNRTWLCGFLLDILVSRSGLCDWNARIADRLSPALVSDWMFILRAKPLSRVGKEYEPGYWARFRRWLNRCSQASV